MTAERTKAWTLWAQLGGVHLHDATRDDFFAGWDAAVIAANAHLEQGAIAHFLTEQYPDIKESN